MSITVNGMISELSTKRKCNPDDWNVAAGRLKGKCEVSKEFNAYLDTLQLKVFETKRKLIEIDKELSAENIKSILLGKDQKQKHMLLELFHHHNDQMAALVNKEYAQSTLERYKTSYKHTQSFLAWKYKLQDIDVTKLDYEFISEYAFWLKSVSKCNHNTSLKYLANFKKIIINCIKNNWLRKVPFGHHNNLRWAGEELAKTDYCSF